MCEAPSNPLKRSHYIFSESSTNVLRTSSDCPGTLMRMFYSMPRSASPIQLQHSGAGNVLTAASGIIDEFYPLPSTPSSLYQASFLATSSITHEQHELPSRKKRLTRDQTKLLEMSFNMDNRLEPERKKQLAQDLGLDPRQIAIWYQNRRARTKAKSIGERYSALELQYLGVLEEKKRLELEVKKLRELLGLQSCSKLEEEQCSLVATATGSAASTDEFEHPTGSSNNILGETCDRETIGSKQNGTLTTWSDRLQPSDNSPETAGAYAVRNTLEDVDTQSENDSSASGAINAISYVPADGPKSGLNDPNMQNANAPSLQEGKYYTTCSSAHGLEIENWPSPPYPSRPNSAHHTNENIQQQETDVIISTRSFYDVADMTESAEDQLYMEYLFNLEDLSLPTSILT